MLWAAKRKRAPAFRRHQRGFISMRAAAWLFGSRPFQPRDLFRAGEAGAHFEAYDPTKLGIVRRNLLGYSENIGGNGWSLSGATSQLDAIAAPDGTMTGDALVDNTAAGTHRAITGGCNFVAGQQYTFSTHLKQGTLRYGQITFPTAAFSAGGGVSVDLATGQVSQQSATITSARIDDAGNGWWRCSIVMTADITAASTPSIWTAATAAEGVASGHAGDGTGKIYVWGTQVDKGALTAYQKTTDWNTEYMAAVLESIGMWQDSVGGIPVTGVEQPVGMWLDGKNGKLWARGPRLETNGGFDVDLAGWSGSAVTTRTWVNGRAQVTVTGTTSPAQLAQQIVNLGGAAGRWIEVRANFFNKTGAGGFRVAMYNATAGYTNIAISSVSATLTNGIVRCIGFVPAGATAQVSIEINNPVGAVGDSFQVDDVMVCEILGGIAHATQATSGSRPVLSARVNLFQKTDQLSDAAWVKTDVTATDRAANDGFGVPTLSKIVEGTATGNHIINQTTTIGANVPVVGTATVKAGSRTFVELRLQTTNGGYRVYVNLATGAITVNNILFGTVLSNVSATVAPEGDGSCYRVTLRATSSEANISLIALMLKADASTDSYAGDGAGYVYIGKCDIRTADDAAKNIPAYQRVNTATDYDTDGYPHYLKFDGVDDGMQTPSIPFSGTKAVAFAGVTKSAATGAYQVVGETGPIVDTTNGTFGLGAETSINDASRRTWAAVVRDGTGAQIIGAAIYAVPDSRVLTGLCDMAAAIGSVRLNGVQAASNATVGDGTNLTAQPINIARRNGSSNPLNGRLYSLTFRNTGAVQSNEKAISDAQRYIARLMAITI